MCFYRCFAEQLFQIISTAEIICISSIILKYLNIFSTGCISHFPNAIRHVTIDIYALYTSIYGFECKFFEYLTTVIINAVYHKFCYTHIHQFMMNSHAHFNIHINIVNCVSTGCRLLFSLVSMCFCVK